MSRVAQSTTCSVTARGEPTYYGVPPLLCIIDILETPSASLIGEAGIGSIVIHMKNHDRHAEPPGNEYRVNTTMSTLLSRV